MISRVLRWIVLCGIPYRGQGRYCCLIQPYELASLVPFGRAIWPPEAPLLIYNLLRVAQRTLICNWRRIPAFASLQLFESNKLNSLLQPRVHRLPNALLRLPENSNGTPFAQVLCLWERAPPCGKAPLTPMNTGESLTLLGNDAQIGESIHEELHGQRCEHSLMMRTRMRIPV